MLVLSRERDGVIEIWDPAGDVLGTVSVVDIRSDKVRLGFEFPKSHAVHRAEVAREIRRDREKK